MSTHGHQTHPSESTEALESVARELARHAAAGDPRPALEDEPGAPGGSGVARAGDPRRPEAETELVRVHRLEQSALLRKAVDLAGAGRLGAWAFSAPAAAPPSLPVWRKLCDEELYFARLDGAHVPAELSRLRVLDPLDWGSMADLARRALELERSPRNRLLLARAMILDGEPERAAEFLATLLERPCTPRQRARIHTTLGCVQEALGDPAAALREHERAVALSGDLTSVLACLMLGFVLGDRPRALFAIEFLERQGRGPRGVAMRLQRAIRRARLRYELVTGRAPTPEPALSPLFLECVCEGTPGVAESTYRLFA